MSPVILSIVMIAAFPCAIGGFVQIRRHDKRKGVLMLVMAVVLLANVLIWTF